MLSARYQKVAVSLFLVTWVVVLLTLGGLAPRAVAVLCAVVALLLPMLYLLSPREWRNSALVVASFALVWYSAQILGIQKLPQWHDGNPDSLVYDLHAKALMAHWQGKPVAVESFRLQLPPSQQYWLASDHWGYGLVLASYHFVYELYLGLLYLSGGLDPQIAILSHAALLATLPVLALLLSLQLSTDARVGWIAALLVLLDTSFAVNGAWLLKDTLVTFLTLLGVLVAVRLMRHRRVERLGYAAPLVLIVSALSCLRFPVALAFWLASLCAIASAWARKRLIPWCLLTASIASWFVSGVAKSPRFDVPTYQVIWNGLAGNLQTVRGQAAVLAASAEASRETILSGTAKTINDRDERKKLVSKIVANVNETATQTHGAVADETVTDYFIRLKSRPALTVVQSASRTLFAPYPWVLFTHGFQNTASELFWPGTTLWILALPFLAAGLVGFWKLRSTELSLMLTLVGTCALAYIITLGEFSTRQRQSVAPICWVWSALGIVLAWQRFTSLIHPSMNIDGASPLTEGTEEIDPSTESRA